MVIKYVLYFILLFPKKDLKVFLPLYLKVNSYPENLDKLDSLCQLLKDQTNTRYTIIDMQFDHGRVSRFS